MAVEFLKMSFSIIKWVVLVNISGNGMMFDAGITNGATTASSVDSLTPSLPNWGPTDCWWESSSSIHHLLLSKPVRCKRRLVTDRQKWWWERLFSKNYEKWPKSEAK